MADWSQDRVDILLSLRFLQGGRVVSDQAAVPIAEHFDKLPQPARLPAEVASTSSSAGQRQAKTRLVADNPWMLHHLEEGRKCGKRKSVWEDIVDEKEEVENGDDQEITELAGGIFQELQQVRDSVRQDVVVEFFRIAPLGGNWTLRAHGILYDAYKGWAVGAALPWCDAYHLTKSARFNVNLYGDQGSIEMARAWMHKMSWFYQAWLDHGSACPFFYEAQLVEQYREPQSFTLFSRGLTAGAATRRVQ